MCVFCCCWWLLLFCCCCCFVLLLLSLFLLFVLLFCLVFIWFSLLDPLCELWTWNILYLHNSNLCYVSKLLNSNAVFAVFTKKNYGPFFDIWAMFGLAYPVAMSYLTFSRSTIFTEVLTHIRGSLALASFEAIYYSVSWIGKLEK